MRLLIVLGFVWAAGAAQAVDYSDYDAVCKGIAEAEGDADAAGGLEVCTCAFKAMEDAVGAEVTQIAIQWQFEDKTLPEITDAYTVEEFYALLEEAGPKIDAACAG